MDLYSCKTSCPWPTRGARTTCLTHWPDSSDIVPSGPGHRYFGLGLVRSTFTNSNRWDNFMAIDVV